MKSILHLLCFLLLPVLIQDVSASTLSIKQESFTGLQDYQPTGFGQSFTAEGKYSIVAIDLYVSSSSGGSDATLRLYDFNSALSTLGTEVLSSGTFLESALSGTPAWIRVQLAKPVVASSGRTFAFTVIAKDPGGSSTGWNNYGFNPNNVYPGGGAFGGASGTVTVRATDLAFRVVTVPVSVPEPAPLCLVSVALLGWVAQRRRVADGEQDVRGG
jgi:hypothetical protein